MEITISNITQEQLMEVWNGVGSQSFDYKPPTFCFLEASKEHDLRYYIGGSELDRIAADFKFLKDGLKACFSKKENYKYIPIAFVYYFFLVILGPFAFEYGKKADSWDLVEGRVKKDKEELLKKQGGAVNKMINTHIYGKTAIRIKWPVL